MITPGLRVQDRPHGVPVRHLDGVPLVLKSGVGGGNEVIDVLVHRVVRRHGLGRLRPLQKRVHGPHHKRVGGESADDVVDAGRLLRVPAGHQHLRATDDADGQPAAEGLAVAHDVGLHVVGALRAAGVQAEARVHLVEDEHHPGISAGLPQLVQPLFVAWGWADLPVVGGQHGVARGRLVQVEALQGVDQDRRDLAAAQLDGGQREGAHVLQAQHVERHALVAGDGLHAVPPPVVRPAEGDDQLLVGVEARHADGAHHGLGPGHVERHLVLPGHLSQHADVVEHSVVQGPQEQPLLAGRGPARLNELLVHLVATDVYAIRTTDVHEAVSIQINHIHTVGAVHRHRGVQVVVDDRIERGEAARRREPEVRDHLLELRGELVALGVLLLPRVAELLDRAPAALGDLGTTAVTIEEIRLIDRVLGQDLGDDGERQGQGVGRREREQLLEEHWTAADQQQRGANGERVLVGQAHLRRGAGSDNDHGNGVHQTAERHVTGREQHQKNYTQQRERPRVGLHPK
mmetsp:Transcript_56198/g.93408  ORF Transcript_56198/g.93408 Transcript_56198/m.93408 type:complete len:517 (+) Transcript_56198:1242-2792(+)